MEDLLTNLKGYILTIAPAVVSVVTMIVSLVTSIKKCKDVATDSLSETRRLQKATSNVMTNMSTVLAENYELKAKLSQNCISNTESINYILEELKCINELKISLETQNKLIEEQNKEIDKLKRELATVNKTLEA